MTDNTQPKAREFTMSQYASKDDMIGAMRKRIAELEAELEAVGAGGVQALSAAPAGFVPIAAFDRLHAHAESLAARLLAAEQAAPKAAPGEPSDAEIDAFLDSPGDIEWVIADKRERYRLLVRAVLAKWAAPQQEAQEPVAWESTTKQEE